MTVWKDICAAALVGTDRHPWEPPRPIDKVTALLSQMAATGPDRLLKAAAIAATHYNAGLVASSTTRSALEPAQPDLRPRCGARAAHYLRSMLEGVNAGVLPEFLELLIASGRRVPEELVPALMTVGLRSNRDLVVSATGSVGEWLAHQNVEWAARWKPQTDGIVWVEATTEQRLALLQMLRQQEPNAAQALVESTWKSDGAEQRRQYIEAFGTGLNAGDEPFLEMALDDRAAAVRRAAADMLGRLPDSGLARRVEAVSRPLLTIATKGVLLNRKKAIALELLRDLQSALIRDGVERTGAPAGMGERAWWTTQAIRMIDPSHWCDWLHLTPDQIIAAAWEGEDARLLTDAWASAAVRHSDAEWARELLLSERPPEQIRGLLFRVLPPREREEVALAKPESTTYYLGLCQHPWSPDFTRKVVSFLSKLYPPQLRDMARFASLDCTIELALDSPAPLVEFDSVLRFRREMRAALQNHE